MKWQNRISAFRESQNLCLAYWPKWFMSQQEKDAQTLEVPPAEFKIDFEQINFNRKKEYKRISFNYRAVKERTVYGKMDPDAWPKEKMGKKEEKRKKTYLLNSYVYGSESSQIIDDVFMEMLDGQICRLSDLWEIGAYSTIYPPVKKKEMVYEDDSDEVFEEVILSTELLVEEDFAKPTSYKTMDEQEAMKDINQFGVMIPHAYYGKWSWFEDEETQEVAFPKDRFGIVSSTGYRRLINFD